jgi:intracellular multiplication protein IcmE
MAMQSEVKRQTGIIVTAIVLGGLLICYVLYSYMAAPGRASSQLAPLNPVGKGTQTAESPHYNDVQRKYDNRNAESAEQSGKTYISGLSTRETPVKPVEKVEPARPAQQAAQQQIVYIPPAPTTGGRVLSKDDQDSLKAMMMQWSGGKGIVKAKVDEEPDYAEDFKAPKAATTTSGDADGASGAMTTLQHVVVVQPYATTYAQLKTEIDTDETSLVKAEVPPGQPYAGAVLYATGYKRLNNDVDMTFDAMVYQGHSYKIDAKPVDLDTSRTALSGEVHHHYFSRIVLPALATGIGATGQLFANANQQTIVTPQGGIITTSPDTPSVRNIAGTFAGGIGQNASQVLSQEAAQIPVKQTIVHRNQMIGIQFIGPVLASDDLALAKTGQAAADVTAPIQMAGSTGMKPAVLQTPQPHLPAGLKYTTAPQTAGIGIAQ